MVNGQGNVIYDVMYVNNVIPQIPHKSHTKTFQTKHSQNAQTAAPGARGHPAAVPLRPGHREGRDPPLQRRSRARAEGGARRAQSHAPLHLLPGHLGRGGLPQYSGLHRGPNIQIFR